LPAAFEDAINAPNTSHTNTYGWLEAYPHLLAEDVVDLLFRLTQRFALASFFFSHSREDSVATSSWQVADGWLNYSRHKCDWFGCSCSANSTATVASIELEKNGLEGRFSSPAFELGLLWNGLIRLLLGENSIEGPLPALLGLLTTLSALRLDGNSSAGMLPTELGEITLLNDLSCRDVEGLRGIVPSEIG
jgi:hypothetical protein